MILRVVLAALALQALPALAQSAKPQLIADPKTGCQVWNLYPGPTDGIAWSGACSRGLANGHGVLQWFVDSKPFMRFEGDYRDGKENGHGVSAWASGNRFVGEFRDGLPNGDGTFTTTKGAIYTGNWVNGCFQQGQRRAVAHTTWHDCGFK